MPEHLRILGAALEADQEGVDRLTDEDMVVAANAAFEALEARGVDLKGVAPVLRKDDPGVGFDLGELSVARALEGPMATLAIKGDDGSGRVDVPQDKIEPLARTLEYLRSIYDPNDPAPLVGDGGAKCGRRTCEEPKAVGYTNEYGSIRVRCDVHALADGVDGVGETRAERILDELSLEHLVETCAGADGVHAPTRLSRIDGLGPSSASSIAKAVDESNVAESVREKFELATDGGTAVDGDQDDVDVEIDDLGSHAEVVEESAEILEADPEDVRSLYLMIDTGDGLEVRSTTNDDVADPVGAQFSLLAQHTAHLGYLTDNPPTVVARQAAHMALPEVSLAGDRGE